MTWWRWHPTNGQEGYVDAEIKQIDLVHHEPDLDEIIKRWVRWKKPAWRNYATRRNTYKTKNKARVALTSPKHAITQTQP